MESRFGNQFFATGSGVVVRGLLSELKGDLRATFLSFFFVIFGYSFSADCVFIT